MAADNGVDLGSIAAMLQQVLVSQESTRRSIERIETRLDRIETRLDRIEIRLDRVEARLDALERRMDSLEHRMRDLEHDVASVRQTLNEYHAAVVGHGISITDLDARVRRIEQRLDLESSH